MRAIIYIGAYLLIMNLLGFISMGIDKRKAKKRAFRIPEATLLTYAILGGCVGSILGMILFRHKTRHWYFRIGLPVILLAQILLITMLVLSPINFYFL